MKRKTEDDRKKKEEEGKEREYQAGRHMPQKVTQISGIRSGWRCRICRCMSSTKAKLDEKKCKGAAANKWEELAATAAAVAKKGTDGHTRAYSGEVVWCSTCGAYADKKAHGVQDGCKEAPKREEEDGKYKYGGMWGQLRKLMRRVHPKTGEVMEEHRNKDGSLWEPSLRLYSNLKPPTNPQPPFEGFYTYVFEPKTVLAQ